MDDPLQGYIVDGKLDLIRLVNDDFCLAIKQTYNARHYTSALKLLLSFIDTISFIWSSESNAATFKRWVVQYVDLRSVGISPDQLWEHRNALLHLTSYESRKVRSGQIPALTPFIGNGRPMMEPGVILYPLNVLMKEVMLGVTKCIEEVGRDATALERFLANYGETISDSYFRRYGASEL